MPYRYLEVVEDADRDLVFAVSLIVELVRPSDYVTH